MLHYIHCYVQNCVAIEMLNKDFTLYTFNIFAINIKYFEHLTELKSSSL